MQFWGLCTILQASSNHASIALTSRVDVMASSACTRICVVCSVGEDGVVANAEESASCVAAGGMSKGTSGGGDTGGRLP